MRHTPHSPSICSLVPCASALRTIASGLIGAAICLSSLSATAQDLNFPVKEGLGVPDATLGSTEPKVAPAQALLNVPPTSRVTTAVPATVLAALNLAHELMQIKQGSGEEERELTLSLRDLHRKLDSLLDGNTR